MRFVMNSIFWPRMRPRVWKNGKKLQKNAKFCRNCFFSLYGPRLGTKNDIYEKSQITFALPIKLNNLAKNGIPRVSRSQNKWISKWENLSFWLKFPDVLVKKVRIGANFDRLYLSSESIFFNSVKSFWKYMSWIFEIIKSLI